MQHLIGIKQILKIGFHTETTREEVEQFLKAKRGNQGMMADRSCDKYGGIAKHHSTAEYEQEENEGDEFGTLAEQELKQFFKDQDVDDGKL